MPDLQALPGDFPQRFLTLATETAAFAERAWPVSGTLAGVFALAVLVRVVRSRSLRVGRTLLLFWLPGAVLPAAVLAAGAWFAYRIGDAVYPHQGSPLAVALVFALSAVPVPVGGLAAWRSGPDRAAVVAGWALWLGLSLVAAFLSLSAITGGWE